MPGMTATSNSPIRADCSSIARTRSSYAAAPPLRRNTVLNACSPRAAFSISARSPAASGCPVASAHAVMSSSFGSSWPFLIFHTLDWTMPMRLASAFSDSPAASRNPVSRVMSAARFARPGVDGGIVKAGSLLRQAALQVGAGGDVGAPRGSAMEGRVTRPAQLKDLPRVADAARATPCAVRLIVHDVEPGAVEQPEVLRVRYVLRPVAASSNRDDADVLASGYVRRIALGEFLLHGHGQRLDNDVNALIVL